MNNYFKFKNQQVAKFITGHALYTYIPSVARSLVGKKTITLKVEKTMVICSKLFLSWKVMFLWWAKQHRERQTRLAEVKIFNQKESVCFVCSFSKEIVDCPEISFRHIGRFSMVWCTMVNKIAVLAKVW